MKACSHFHQTPKKPDLESQQNLGFHSKVRWFIRLRDMKEATWIIIVLNNKWKDTSI